MISVSRFKLFLMPFTLVLFASFLNAMLNINKEHYEHEKKLMDKLTKSYNLLLRPSGTVQVQLALNLIQIIEILEKDQIMVLNAFIDQKWNDKRLAWGNFFPDLKLNK
jgi:hypothetical protein